jgi:hypothetical protein
MSYLQVPRIHFAGQFFTDPSTVDNDPAHYTEGDLRPSPWQDPFGQHRFQFRNCTVRSAIDLEGKRVNDPRLIGISIESTDLPSEAKMADLDVYQQGVSTIYGLSLKLTFPDGSTLTGVMDPAVLNGVAFNTVLPQRGWRREDSYGQGSYGGDSVARGVFQSLIRFPLNGWTQNQIPLFNQLVQNTASDSASIILSIRMTLDAYINNPENANYRVGRLVGALGTWQTSQPVATPGHRWLTAIESPDEIASKNPDKTPPWYVPAFYDAPFLLDERRKCLVFDLSNSVATESVGGPPVDTGTLTAIDSGTHEPLGKVHYSSFLYENSSGICEIPLDDNGVQRARENSVQLLTSREDIGPSAIWSEQPDGLHLAMDDRVLRVPGAPGTIRTARAHLTRWGRPVPNAPLEVQVVSVTNTDGKLPAGATVPPIYPGNTPKAEGAIEAKIARTDDNGFAVVSVKVLKDPGSRTSQLDGQLYFLYPSLDGQPDLTQELRLSVLAWSDFPIDKQMTWEEVRDIMAPYVKLYPSMRERLDLSDPTSFEIYARNPPFNRGYYGTPDGFKILDRIDGGAIPFFLACDINDPRYMPVTRDLSPNKVLSILYYIQNQYFPPK